MSYYKKVSVIIPTYNRFEFFKEAIESIEKQIFKNFDIIVVDDCSQMEIFLMMEELLKAKSFQSKLIRMEENSGPCKCRNIGIELAKGDFVAFLDSDDTWLPNHLEVLIDEQIKSDADYVYSGWVWKSFVTNSKRVSRIPNPKNGLIDGKPRWQYNIIPQLVRTSLIKDLKFSEEISSYELYEFNIRLWNKSRSSYVPYVTQNFRDHKGQRNSSNIEKRIFAIDYILEKHSDFLKSYKKFNSNLLLTKAIYQNKVNSGNPKKTIYQSINTFPFNFRSYYFLFKFVLKNI